MPSYWLLIFLFTLIMFLSLMSFSSSSFFPKLEEKSLDSMTINSWLK